MSTPFDPTGGGGGVDFGSLLKQVGDQLSDNVVPIGDYDCTVKTAEFAEASTGRKGYKVKYSVDYGPHAGMSIFNNYWIVTDNPNALAMFFRNMAVHGLDQNFFQSNPSPETVANAMLQRRVNLTVAHREWQGRKQADVKNVKTAKSSAPQAAPGETGIAAVPSNPAPAMSKPAAPAPAPAPAPTPAPAAAPAPPQSAPQPAAPTPEPAPQQVQPEPQDAQVPEVQNAPAPQEQPEQAAPAPAPTPEAAPQQQAPAGGPPSVPF